MQTQHENDLICAPMVIAGELPVLTLSELQLAAAIAQATDWAELVERVKQMERLDV